MIVLDCSAAIAIVQRTEQGAALRKLIDPGEKVIAPSLFTTEVANVAWKYVHADMVTASRAKQMTADALALVDEYVPVESLIEESFATAIHLDHSVYDITYLVLARRNAAIMMTCDLKLQRLCEDAGVSCIAEVAL
ncbi:MAG: type II toxin-antitoxin system VapC family toxin [Coriobacteriia bacterium]|nr:type II toxin-antitoxin system VapC family toxin [Coriobacteriia bacterium]